MVVQICQYMTHMATLCDFACSSNICLIWRPGTVQGTVINVSSGASRVPMPHNQRYGVAKAAQDALTKALAFEFAPKGVRINAILPGELSAFVSADIMPDDTGCRLHSYTLARTTYASDCFLSVTNNGFSLPGSPFGLRRRCWVLACPLLSHGARSHHRASMHTLSHGACSHHRDSMHKLSHGAC